MKSISTPTLRRALPVGTGSLAALLAATNASGQIIHVQTPLVINLNDQEMVSWDIDGDGTSDFGFLADSNPTTATAPHTIFHHTLKMDPATNLGNAPGLSSMGLKLRNLVSGNIVGPVATTTGASTGTTNGDFFRQVGGDLVKITIGTALSASAATSAKGVDNFTDNQSGFIGFRFDTNDINGSSFAYGWARVTFSLTGDTSTTGLTIHEWAYNTAEDENIQVGAVPEPATATTGLALLSLGAAGLRRKRAKA